jgi:small multidrug resistance pump
VTAWLLLGLAIAAEVAGTTALRASNGLTRVLPVVVVVVAYLLSFALLALVLKHLALGTTYAIWAGVGTVAIAAIGRLVYRDAISSTTAAGMALVVVGVVVIHLGGGVQR